MGKIICDVLCLHLIEKLTTLASGNPGDDVVQDFQPIFENFGLNEVINCEVIQSGLMHSTFKVQTSASTYILQRLHHKLSTQAILNDYVRVTTHLQKKGFSAPTVCKTHDGRYIYVDSEAQWWRLTTYVSGDTHERVSSVEQATQGAQILGGFHMGMRDFPFEFESAHPLHDTDGHLDGLAHALSNREFEENWHLVADVATKIVKLMSEVRVPDGLPQRVVHGDPKISNVMFSAQQAIGMIDLDTCNRHTVLVDLGDAIRSWCRDGYEDEAQRFHLDRFEGILDGYAKSGAGLSVPEIDALWMAGPMITLELASRFARDVLEDSYFAFNSDHYPSRRQHNLARMKSMLFLAQDMLSQSDEMKSLIQRYFPTKDK